MKKIVSFFGLPIARQLAAAALIGLLSMGDVLAAPFSDEDVATNLRPLYYGINKLYQEEPEDMRPEGCVVFELRILRNGTASAFKKVEGDFDNHALLKKIQHFVLWRFSAPKDRLEEPQLARHTVCFNGADGVGGKPDENPPAPLPQAADLMDHERNGVTNKEWLEQMMKEEGTAPALPDAAASSAQRPVQPPLPLP